MALLVSPGRTAIALMVPDAVNGPVYCTAVPTTHPAYVTGDPVAVSGLVPLQGGFGEVDDPFWVFPEH
jgi:hypothetical protein